MMKRERGRRRAANRPRPRTQDRPSPPPAGRRELVILGAVGAPILALAGLAALAFGGPSAGGPPSAPPGQGSSATGLVERLVHPDSPTFGPATAPVTLVEFLDPECEACRAAYPIVKQLLADYDGKVRLVVRYIAGHGNSALAAAALEEAGRQGRYWEMLAYLFERQPEWGEQSEPQAEAFLQYGAAVGLDVERLRAALATPDLSKVERDAADAAALGVRATPTFFVNGTRVDELSEQGLRSAIDRALAP